LDVWAGGTSKIVRLHKTLVPGLSVSQDHPKSGPKVLPSPPQINILGLPEQPSDNRKTTFDSAGIPKGRLGSNEVNRR
jgi:hypothetical protein